MVMNGYELKLLAYSLTKPKPPPHPVPNTTRFKLKSILTELNSGKTDGSAINSSISQGSQTYSAKQYMKELNRARQRKTFNVGNQRQDVNQLEQSITPITCQQADQDQTGPWGALAASIRARVHSVIQVQGYLREFYPPYIFKMKSRHLRQAKMATLNKGVSKLLCTAGCKEKWTETGNDTRVLFAVGDGNFGSTKGPVEGLNHVILRVPEFRTSLVCCQCGNIGELRGRSHHCNLPQGKGSRPQCWPQYGTCITVADHSQ
ncbi:hypothetical protein BGX20_002472 [Mortierella sp. AD010]|nr:hypothetical protein BGX20_002472 [Mortierella sp. AD010]